MYRRTAGNIDVTRRTLNETKATCHVLMRNFLYQNKDVLTVLNAKKREVLWYTF
jgi:hypothetical protein